ncbi:UDP-2-acetamido-2-deoxy-ribo-hexuluronate aminotransferase [uncultured bacterium]|nr:UDP-2-acetamido-2-deoxy-ribo-hexuluronate aminotransferase [uncultured bacterium]
MNKTGQMTGSSDIPFLDLVSPHLELEEELVEVYRRSLRNAAFIGGPAVEGFEKDFARFCGAYHCAGVSSGTDALRFAIMASGVKPGDTVVTVSNTFIATVEAITQAGATPAFVDIDEATFNMDPELLAEYLEARCDIGSDGRPVDRRTKSPVTAVVPVHLYGQACRMDRIMEIAERHKLKVIEDACQAHGAEYYSEREKSWKRAGSMGIAAAFSFYPGKNLGACGEGGAVTTMDAGIDSASRMLRDHGQTRKYHHAMEGYNGRLDSIQAGILGVKLKKLEAWNDMRRQRARTYGELFEGCADVITPEEPSGSKAVWHLYVVRVKERDALQKRLSENGVGTGLHYPVPLHLQKACERYGYRRGELPVTERLSEEILSLPMFPGLTCGQQERVAELILGGR